MFYINFINAGIRITGILLIIILGVGNHAAAQSENLEFLQEPPQQGTLNWGLSLGYTPNSETGQLMDQAGKAYRWIRTDQRTELGLNASYLINDTVTCHWGAYGIYGSSSLALENGPAYSVRNTAKTSWRGTSEIEIRLPQQNTDITLMAGYPWAVGVGVTANATLDPAVIHGSVQYTTRLHDIERVLTVSGRMGLVLNERISMLFSVSHIVQLGAIQLPSTVYSLGTTLSGSNILGGQVTLLASLEAKNGQTQAGFTLKFHNIDLI